MVIRKNRTTTIDIIISTRQSRAKALDEYRKYQVRTLSPVEQAYIAQLKEEAKKAKGKK